MNVVLNFFTTGCDLQITNLFDGVVLNRETADSLFEIRKELDNTLVRPKLNAHSFIFRGLEQVNKNVERSAQYVLSKPQTMYERNIKTNIQ